MANTASNLLWRVAVTGPEIIIAPITEILDRKALAVATVKLPGELWLLEATYAEEPDRAEFEADLMILKAAFELAELPALEVGPLPALDWREHSYRGFPPIKAGRFHVHGDHDTSPISPSLWPLTIAAATAFGSGEHATTYGCLLALDHLARQRPGREHWTVADIGCGSGILALGWARAVKARAIASDLDPEAVRVTKKNALVNGLAARVRVTGGAGYHAPLIRKNKPYKLVTANILARPLCKLAKDLRRNLAPGGRVILSGLLSKQEAMVLSAHRRQRLYLQKRWRSKDGWSVLLLSKKQRHQ